MPCSMHVPTYSRSGLNYTLFMMKYQLLYSEMVHLIDFNYFMYFFMTNMFGVPMVKLSLKVKMKAILSAIRTSNIQFLYLNYLLQLPMSLQHKVFLIFQQNFWNKREALVQIVQMLIHFLLMLHLMTQLLLPIISYNLIYNENQVIDAIGKSNFNT